MSYVFDNSPLSVLFKNYYRGTFKSLWEHFDELVGDGSIVSTREVLREIEDGAPARSMDACSGRSSQPLRLRNCEFGQSLDNPTAPIWRPESAQQPGLARDRTKGSIPPNCRWRGLAAIR
jgi:hypothetical protein